WAPETGSLETVSSSGESLANLTQDDFDHFIRQFFEIAVCTAQISGNDRSGLLQPEEERSRPRRPGNLSRDCRQRVAPGALPGETVIEDHDFVGPPLPLAHQPGSWFQLGAETFRSRSGVLQLHSDLA